MRPVATALPIGGAFSFEAVLRREGGGGLRLTVPPKVVRGTQHAGWPTPGWLRVRINAGATFFAMSRQALSSRGAVTSLAIPIRARDTLLPGDRVLVELRGVDVVRARPARTIADEGLDWLDFIPPDVLAIEPQPGVLELHTRWEPPFTLRRRAPWRPLLWILGLYGRRRRSSARAWGLGHREHGVVADVEAALGTLGILHDRLIRPPGAIAIRASRVFARACLALLGALKGGLLERLPGEARAAFLQGGRGLPLRTGETDPARTVG